ncbi:Hypothetical protein SRAE_1000245900 [Strongyloides ratti]|uniref:Uncharacterized protein n=1 Tax=Strongyloides ratti TaxID=34506 RepID=A0A090MWS7_STRRB|nr:Hypothetical protein SRAE_1000245900 [Strongyloides ratti]CEF64204.1 Hypothetical protein SRAE_1000245900 [Strongyloides ratti]
MFLSYKYATYIIAIGIFFVLSSICSFGFKCQTIFLNIPHYKSLSLSLGFECFSLFFAGEALAYLSAEFIVHYVGYRIVLKFAGFFVCIFFLITLSGNIFLIRIGALIVGVAVGNIWTSITSFLKYSRSNPWNEFSKKVFAFLPFFVVVLFPMLGITTSLPSSLPVLFNSPPPKNVESKFSPQLFEHLKDVVSAKIFYEHLLEYLIFSLLGTFLLCVQPRLWKIVGMKINSEKNLQLTLVDYNNEKDSFSKSINELYKKKRKIIIKSWKSDIRSIPFIICNRFMIIGYFPLLYIGAMTAYVGPLMTSGINYGDIERDLSTQTGYLTILTIFICIGRGVTHFWSTFNEKERYAKNRKGKLYTLLLTLVSLLIISFADIFLPRGQVDLLYGIVRHKFSFATKFLILLRLLGISFLSMASAFSEYYIYGYFEILGQEFGSKVMYIVRIIHCIATMSFVLIFQNIPIHIFPLVMSIFILITAINFSKAEKYLIKSIFITQGVSQTTITKNKS